MLKTAFQKALEKMAEKGEFVPQWTPWLEELHALQERSGIAIREFSCWMPGFYRICGRKTPVLYMTRGALYSVGPRGVLRTYVRFVHEGRRRVRAVDARCHKFMRGLEPLGEKKPASEHITLLRAVAVGSHSPSLPVDRTSPGNVRLYTHGEALRLLKA